MIERYSRPEMTRIWDPEARMRRMLEVEAAFLRGIARTKRIPSAQIRAFERWIDRGPLGAKVKRKEAKSGHDVVALLEVAADAMARKAPAVVRYLHYALTSSDVLDTALALQMRDSCVLLADGWKRVLSRIRTLAARHKDTWMVGRTHGVHAEPIPFGLKVAGWHAEARRNLDRVTAVRKAVSFGKLSGAVGTYAHCPPALEGRVLRLLKLKPEPIGTQVVPRDRHAEYLQTLALSACAVERFATEIRHLQRTEVLEAEEPFRKGQKGSSAMPHKRNPILCENLCGLARVVRGFAAPALENVALWHERDISHSSVERVSLPDASVLLDFMLHRFAGVIKGLTVYRGAMRENLARSCGLVFSQRVLLALVDKGLERMRAYAIVQRAAMETWRSRRYFQEVLAEDPEAGRLLPGRELDRCFDLGRYGRHVSAVLKREGVL